MTVRAFDGAVLVSDAGIVAGRLHAVVGDEVLIATRQVLACLPAQVAEGRRQAVAAMLVRGAAERPQGVLQAVRQGHEALAAEHDMGMLEAAVSEPEVIEAMVERLAGDGDSEAGHVGEIRQSEAAGPMGLAEDDLPLLAMDGPPGANAPRQRAAHTLAQLGVPPHHLLEDRHRPDAGRGLEQRHNLGIENAGRRVGAPAAAPHRLLGRQARILLDAIGARCADRCLCRRDGRRMGLSELHVKPHLLIGYVAAGHKAGPPNRKDHRRTRPTAITRKAQEQAAAAGRKLRSGYALPAFPPSGILILIDADLSP